MLSAAAMQAASPRAQRVRKVSTGLRRVTSLLSKTGSGKARSGGSDPVSAPTQGWADDLDPVLAAARWAAEAAAHTPRTAREMMQQCPVDPRQMVAPEPRLDFEPPVRGPEDVATATASSVDILRCHRSRTPSPVTVEPEVAATALAGPHGGIPECTCEFSNGDLRCVHLFEVSDEDATGGSEPSDFGGGSSQSRGSFTLPTTPIKYAAAREHLDAQLGARLPSEYVFVRGGIPVGKKQELKWETTETTLVIKAKHTVAGKGASTTPVEALVSAPTPSVAMPWGDDVMEIMDDVADRPAEQAQAQAQEQAQAQAQQQEEEELRYDEDDGEAYSRASFIEVYGYEEGVEAWRTARVARPAVSTRAAARAPAPAMFGSAATACSSSSSSSSRNEAQLMYPGITAAPVSIVPPMATPTPTPPACAGLSFGGVPTGLSVKEALERVSWNVAYGRVMSI